MPHDSPPMNDRKARLRELISECGNISAFSKRYGFDASYLSQMLNGHRSIGEKTARKIESATGRPAGWLDSDNNNVEAGPPLRGKVPMISWVKAGEWCEASDLLAPGDAEQWIDCPRDHSGRTFALRVVGESMSPRFQPGEIIMVDPEAPADHGKYVIAKKTGTNEVTFKQLIKEGGDAYLKAVNPHWPEPIIRINEEWTVCGTVICRVELF